MRLKFEGGKSFGIDAEKSIDQQSPKLRSSQPFSSSNYCNSRITSLLRSLTRCFFELFLATLFVVNLTLILLVSFKSLALVRDAVLYYMV